MERQEVSWVESASRGVLRTAARTRGVLAQDQRRCDVLEEEGQYEQAEDDADMGRWASHRYLQVGAGLCHPPGPKLVAGLDGAALP
jgi:hypothetical protein